MLGGSIPTGGQFCKPLRFFELRYREPLTPEIRLEKSPKT